MKNITYLLFIIPLVILIACQSTDKPSDQKKIEKKEQKSTQNSLNKNKPQKQQIKKKPTKKQEVKGKNVAGKKTKFPSLDEQKKVLGLTDKQVNNIVEAQRAAKRDRNIAKNKGSGKIGKNESTRINNIKESKIRKSLGVELYKKRQEYIKNFKNL